MLISAMSTADAVTGRPSSLWTWRQFSNMPGTDRPYPQNAGEEPAGSCRRALLWSWSGLDPSAIAGMVGKGDDAVIKSSHPTFGFNRFTAIVDGDERGKGGRSARARAANVGV